MLKFRDVSVAIIINNEGKILVGKRPKDKPLSGQWEFPGGKVETGESYEEALKRELYEEIFVDESSYKIKELLGKFKSHHSDTIFNLYVYICVANDSFLILEHPVHEEIKFVELNEIEDLNLIESNHKILKKLQIYLSKNSRFV